ncbi:Dihydroorotase [Prochlorococcus marinus str. MIT 9515]|uniref:Dihydroorotase n=1 Tax=Prochlorococcus marinus (strain MIT 9515) TaxID=167542 RepID=A2BVN1_PROM5|nr:dihydroorotase [Prochlorococcus marinus]ABM71842.1 Dihydroorotase [Prochlorococcus marinus str. MIT 9515]
MKDLTILKPDDWHLHLREGIVLKNIIKFSSEFFGRAIVMPNTKNPITSINKCISYKKSISEGLPENSKFEPLMTIYLTDETIKDELIEGFKNDVFFAAKLYPANATTNSSQGVKKIENLYEIFEVMEELGMPLLIHGEVTDPKVDIFDREVVFIDKELLPLIQRFPKLKIVLEHITTSYAVSFVQENNLGATITPHHLHINRNAMFFGGLNSDFYCLPVAKRENNRIALRKAATSGKKCFFLGTDSAPHLRQWKAFCGCAGIFNSPVAIESYIQVFDEEDSLDQFEKFASLNGPNFYNLPVNKEKIRLVSKSNEIPKFIEVIDNNKVVGQIKPFHAGEILNWQVEGIVN